MKSRKRSVQFKCLFLNTIGFGCCSNICFSDFSVSSSVSNLNQLTSTGNQHSGSYRGKDDTGANNDFGVTCTVSGPGFQSSKPSSKTAALLTASSYTTTHSPSGANYSVPSTLNAPISTVYYSGVENGAKYHQSAASAAGAAGVSDVIVTTTSSSPSRSPPARYNLRSTQV